MRLRPARRPEVRRYRVLAYDCLGPEPTRFRCIMAMSPLSPSCKFAISNVGAPSRGLGPAPGNCRRTCLEFELRTTDAISSEGANSIVVIWHGTVTKTVACPGWDGVSWTGAASEFDTSCRPATATEDEPLTAGRCCDGNIRIVPRALPSG